MIVNRERNSPILWMALVLSWLVAPVFAGVRIEGEVEEVAEQVEQAFDELEIETSETHLEPNRAMAVGQARSGARLMVSVENVGEDECELSITADDDDIEERFLRLMQAR